MQVFLQLNSPLGSGLGPNFNLTADVGLVFPSTVTGANLLAGILVNVNALAIAITVTSVGTCTNSIVIPIITPSTTTTTTGDPGMCFTWYVDGTGNITQTIAPNAGPGYGGKSTYTIPGGLGIVYWSPSQSRWEFSSLLDSGTLWSTLNYSGSTPLSGSPNNWVATGPSPYIVSSLTGVCPTTTTTTSSTSTTTSTSSTSTTSTSSTTSTTTAAPTCCEPTITSVLQNGTTGNIEVSYTLNTSPSCLSATQVRLEYSTDGGSTWILGNTTAPGSMISTGSKPSGTQFRLQVICGGSSSTYAGPVTFTILECTEYYNNTVFSLTGINYTSCDGTVFTNQTVSPGQSICVENGSISGPNSGFLIVLGSC